MPDEAAVLSIDFKTNLLAPAKGDSSRFVGTVFKAGRTMTVCEGRAWVQQGPCEKPIATMTGTLRAALGRGIAD